MWKENERKSGGGGEREWEIRPADNEKRLPGGKVIQATGSQPNSITTWKVCGMEGWKDERGRERWCNCISTPSCCCKPMSPDDIFMQSWWGEKKKSKREERRGEERHTHCYPLSSHQLWPAMFQSPLQSANNLFFQVLREKNRLRLHFIFAIFSSTKN